MADLAVSLTAEILKEFESDVASITLIPSDGGRFELTANDYLVFSKIQTGKRAEIGEIIGLLKKYLKEE